ncbi:RNA polymerase sigma factor [Brumimicrobium aurantiacum]|uniref:RNA polymerase sigma factor n=1 Tax=Brumimicrobium aurantiacum TaxID=1737063 RepID=A0A3E1EW66_9FLAO|nr:RNA polymerase sigma factor [Brumimicrobium aurantiacum]RFC53762.1 RNA polymerase sigma factor [Brumimicrobium aurantiacum]
MTNKKINTNSSDEQLMSFLQKGSDSAFSILYERYSNRILFFMFKMLRNDEAKAQDFTQDIFIKVIESAHQFKTNKSFKTWIFTIAANHCKNHFRSVKHFADIDREAGALTYAVDHGKSMDQKLFQKRLSIEVDKLALHYRQTFVLRYHEELKIKEIAEIMDCPIGTVKSRLNHTINHLGEKLQVFKSLSDNFKLKEN